MRRRVRCMRCFRSAYTLYIRPTKTVKVDISRDPQFIQKLAIRVNPTLTSRTQYWKPIGYWCPFCGYVEITEKPKIPNYEEILKKHGENTVEVKE